MSLRLATAMFITDKYVVPFILTSIDKTISNYSEEAIFSFESQLTFNIFVGILLLVFYRISR